MKIAFNETKKVVTTLKISSIGVATYVVLLTLELRCLMDEAPPRRDEDTQGEDEVWAFPNDYLTPLSSGVSDCLK